MAANALERFLPMLTTAAGTIRPAKVLVIGAGVAGLQAIATASGWAPRCMAYDVRTDTKEQVESLGAEFLVAEGVKAEAEGGYARELTDEEKAEAAGDAGQAHGRRRRGDHHRRGTRPAGAQDHLARRWSKP